MSISVAIVTAIIALLTSAVGGVWSWKKNNISGAREVTESALMLIQPQSERINELIQAVEKLDGHVHRLQGKIYTLEQHIDLLANQIISLGHTPIIYHLEKEENNND